MFSHLICLDLVHEVLHVDEAHVLRMRDDPVGQERLDHGQSWQGDVVCLFVRVNDCSNRILGVLQLSEVPEELSNLLLGEASLINSLIVVKIVLNNISCIASVADVLDELLDDEFNQVNPIFTNLQRRLLPDLREGFQDWWNIESLRTVEISCRTMC